MALKGHVGLTVAAGVEKRSQFEKEEEERAAAILENRRLEASRVLIPGTTVKNTQCIKNNTSKQFKV